jgi:hypothetical protein
MADLPFPTSLPDSQRLFPDDAACQPKRLHLQVRSMINLPYQGEAYRNVFLLREMTLFDQACTLVSRVPYEVLGSVVRCHEMVRAASVILDLTFEDGFYGMVEHSWLWLEPRQPLSPSPRILDVYVPGRIPQVQMIDSITSLPWEYRRGPPRTDINRPMVSKLIRLMTTPTE